MREPWHRYLPTKAGNANTPLVALSRMRITRYNVSVVAVRTPPGVGAKGIGPCLMERGMPRFETSGWFEKPELKTHDTAELFGDKVHLPADRP